MDENNNIIMVSAKDLLKWRSALKNNESYLAGVEMQLKSTSEKASVNACNRSIGRVIEGITEYVGQSYE